MEVEELLGLLASDRGYLRLRPPVSTRPNEIVEILQDNLVWFSSVSDQDDIFEGRPVIRVRDEARIEDMLALAERNMPGAAHEERVVQAELMYRRLQDPEVGPELRRGVANGLRRLYAGSSILCLFKSVQSQAYWDQYASSGAGYALVFDMATPWNMVAAVGMDAMDTVPFQVRYVEGDRPIVEVPLAPADPQTGFDDIERALLTKSIEWIHQREWRFVRIGIPGGLVEFPKASLAAIVLGYSTSKTDKSALLSAVTTYLPGLPVFEVAEDDQSYMLGVRKFEQQGLETS